MSTSAVTADRPSILGRVVAVIAGVSLGGPIGGLFGFALTSRTARDALRAVSSGLGFSTPRRSDEVGALVDELRASTGQMRIVTLARTAEHLKDLGLDVYARGINKALEDANGRYDDAATARLVSAQLGVLGQAQALVDRGDFDDPPQRSRVPVKKAIEALTSSGKSEVAHLRALGVAEHQLLRAGLNDLAASVRAIAENYHASTSERLNQAKVVLEPHRAMRVRV